MTVMPLVIGMVYHHTLVGVHHVYHIAPLQEETSEGQVVFNTMINPWQLNQIFLKDG